MGLLFLLVIVGGGAFGLGYLLGQHRMQAALDDVEPLVAKLEAGMRARVICAGCRCCVPNREHAVRQGWELDPPRCFGCRTDEGDKAAAPPVPGRTTT